MNIDLDGDEINESNWYTYIVLNEGYSIDGQNHTIFNMTMETDTNAGFLYYVREGSIVMNLHLSDININTKDMSASEITGSNEGTIINCSSSGKLIGGSSSSGIASINFGLIIGCVNYCDITSNDGGFIGGIVGQMLGEANVIACSNIGNLKGLDTVGGVIGSFFEGNIIASYNTGITELNNEIYSYCGGVTGYGEGNFVSTYWVDVEGDDAVIGNAYDEDQEGCTKLSGTSEELLEAMNDMNNAIETYNETADVKCNYKYVLNTADATKEKLPLVLQQISE